MGEEAEDEGVKPSATAEAAAVAAALGSATPEARDYLRRQSRLTDLQIDQLEKSERFDVSHLHFRRLTDMGKLSLQVAIGLVVLLAIGGLGTMVWNAAHDRSMVVEAFAVPPDIAATGMTGSVLANRLIDRFGKLQSNDLAISQGTASYRRDSGDGIRVEIPETGVSIGELDRYLRGWLGHQTHVGGDLVHTAKGYSLTVRYGDAPGAPLVNADMDALLTQGAERLMAQAVPYHYVEYLARRHRFAEALALAPVLAARGDDHDRARAFAAWAATYFRGGDMWDAANKARAGLALEPRNPALLGWASASEGNLVHEEANLRYASAIQQHLTGSLVDDMAPEVVAVVPVLFGIYRNEISGDFQAAVNGWETFRSPGAGVYDPGGHASDAALDHDLVLARRIYASVPLKDLIAWGQMNGPAANIWIAILSEDWPLAVRRGNEAAAIAKAHPEFAWAGVFYIPIRAYALARNGDMPTAEAMIAATPLDCDSCIRARGRIAAVKRDWAGISRWFAMVSARSPHVPFADTDWGEALLHKGELDGAIAHFAIAHQRGPNFADPLEMWGEALVAKDRSDLALAKFAEAAKDAPRWGRLHLKWGEALVYAGRKDEARKQFAIAAGLEMPPADRGELGYQRKITRL